jgi:KAP family P-loop domain
VFLIDDLDRCEPDYVIRFLEVVQTLVRDAPCDDPPGRGRGGSKGPLAIVAADGLWLRSSYENAFGTLMHDDVPGKPVGYRFLEKIFQMHVRLPGVEPATKQRYFESLLFPSGGSTAPTETPTAEDEKLTREVSTEIRSVRTTGDLSALNASISRITDAPTRHHLRSTALQHAVTEEVVHRQIHELSSFADLLDANPRTIRLFVNAVSMQAYLRFLEGATFELSLLALWAVLEQRWPALADHLRAHPEHVTVRAGDVPPDDLPKELFDLLTGREVDRVLRSQRWRPFTPERVLACTGGRLDG